jgi:hypothetical protein
MARLADLDSRIAFSSSHCRAVHFPHRQGVIKGLRRCQSRMRRVENALLSTESRGSVEGRNVAEGSLGGRNNGAPKPAENAAQEGGLLLRSAEGEA